jgi:hypothetical protein
MNSKADHLAIKEAGQTSLEVTAKTAETPSKCGFLRSACYTIL